MFSTLNSEQMITQYIIQKRHPNIGKEWSSYNWHDRVESSPHASKVDAIKECKRLILNAETTKYRLIERKTSEEEIYLENR